MGIVIGPVVPRLGAAGDHTGCAIVVTAVNRAAENERKNFRAFILRVFLITEANDLNIAGCFSTNTKGASALSNKFSFMDLWPENKTTR